MPRCSLVAQRPGKYCYHLGASNPFKKSSGEGSVQELPWEKEVLSSDDMLTKKGKLALKRLISIYLEKNKETWKDTFSSNLEKMIELNSSVNTKSTDTSWKKMYKIKGYAKEPNILQNINFIYLSGFCKILTILGHSVELAFF